MKYRSFIYILLLALDISCTWAKDTTVWQATFANVMPNQAGVSEAYCQAHAPDVFTTTVATILQKGARANNGVLVKYKNYKQAQKNGLYFIEVNAIMSGVYQAKPWQTAMYIHEQRLMPNGVTNYVWSSADCKGTFIGIALNNPTARIN